MSSFQNYEAYQDPYAVPVSARAEFLTRVYTHLFGALLAFGLLEVVFFQTGVADVIIGALMSLGGKSQYTWLLVLGAFMVVGWIASHLAHTAESLAAQYAALGGYVLAESLIFVPILYMAEKFAPGTIQAAALITFLGFALLTAIVFVTRKDFSFLRTILFFGFGIAVITMICGMIFGFQLGLWFSVAMVALAGGAILYDTSNVLHHYPESRYVGASLRLFSSVTTMFWYVLRILMELRR